MRKNALVVLLAAMCITPVAQAVYVNNGYVSGEQYRTRMTTDDQEAFVVGVVSGILAAPLLGGDENKANKFFACISPMGGRQLNVIVNKWIEANPERWHNGMNSSIYFAIKQACNL